MNTKEIAEKVKQLKLPPDEYCIVGSGAMVARGIRDANDVDILVSKELFETLRASGEWKEVFEHRRKLQRDAIECMDTIRVGEYEPDTHAIIARAEIINDIPFQNLHDLLDWKRAMGRKKDLEDIRLIEVYLGKS